MIKVLLGKKCFFPNFNCTHGRMCVYGRYAPDINYYIGEVRTGQRSNAFALTTTTVQLLPFTHTPEALTAEDGPTYPKNVYRTAN